MKLNRETIKYIVIALMTLNHVAWAFLPRGMVLFYVFSDLGYATCVTMCYFLVEGQAYTRSAAAYRKRMLIFALAAQIPYQMAIAGDAFRFESFNVLFNLFLCQWLAALLKDADGERALRPVQIAKLAAVVFLSLFCDWGPMAPLFTALFHRARKEAGRGEAGGRGEESGGRASEAVYPEPESGSPEKRRKHLLRAYLAAGAAFFLYEMIFPTDGLGYAWERWTEEGSFGGSFTALKLLSAAGAVGGVLISMALVVFLYNGKRAAKGRAFHKYFFYVYYPAHLLVIGLVRMLRR